MDNLERALQKLCEDPAFLAAPENVQSWIKCLLEGDSGFSRGKVHVDVWRNSRREPEVWVVEASGMNDPTSLDGRPRIFATRAEAMAHGHWLIENCQDKEVELSVGPEIAIELEMLKTKGILNEKESSDHE